jgi:hypothetical protein
MTEREYPPQTQGEIKRAIAKEICTILERKGAELDLLRIVGSYGDSMDDYWVLGMLREWNEGER